MHPFDSLPLWAFFTTVLLLSLLWTECGYRVGTHRRKKDPKEPDAPLGTVVASILGLLAFMLGFTFNVAINRFDDRREAVLDEANAIGTTYLRADFFDSPAKEQENYCVSMYSYAQTAFDKQLNLNKLSQGQSNYKVSSGQAQQSSGKSARLQYRGFTLAP